MNKQIESYITFTKGIIDITRAKDTRKIRLPELTPFKPSDSQIDVHLSKLWEPASVQNLLQKSMAPVIKDRDSIAPLVYQKKLEEAKDKFVEMIKEREKMREHKRLNNVFDEEDEAIFEQVVADLEELKKNRDLLRMFQQVVLLA